MKRCPMCKEVKDDSEFYAVAAVSPSGLDSYCKPCNLARQRARYRADPTAAQAVKKSGRLRRALRRMGL